MKKPQNVRFHLRIERKDIGYLRFLLEGYDGLAQLVAQSGENEVTLITPQTQRSELSELIDALDLELDSIELLGIEEF